MYLLLLLIIINLILFTQRIRLPELGHLDRRASSAIQLVDKRRRRTGRGPLTPISRSQLIRQAPLLRQHHHHAAGQVTLPAPMARAQWLRGSRTRLVAYVRAAAMGANAGKLGMCLLRLAIYGMRVAVGWRVRGERERECVCGG